MVNIKIRGYILPTEWLSNWFNVSVKPALVPADCKNGISVPLFKGEGSKSDCKNFKVISLLSRKVLGKNSD